MVGGIEVCDILGRPGDLREDWEDVDCISAREDEFLRVEPEVLDADLSLREKSPILAVLIGYRWGGWCGLWMYLYRTVGNPILDEFGDDVSGQRDRRGDTPIGECGGGGGGGRTGAETRLLVRLECIN